MTQPGRFYADGADVRRATLVLVVAGLVASGLTGCDSPRAEAAEPVRLGALYPLTGRSSPSGTGMLAAAKLAVAEANAEGGVLGRKIVLDTADDACDPGSAVARANELARKKVSVSVGGYCSSATVPTVKIFHDARVPMIIPSANSTDLLAAADRDVFLLSGTTSDEARFAADAIRRAGGRRLTVVSDGTSYSAALAAASAGPALAGTGLSVAGQLTLSQGAPSYRRIAEQVRDQGADTVYYTGYYAEAAQLIGDLRDTGYRGKIFVADGCVDGDLLQRLSPQQSDGVYGTALQVPRFVPGVANWVVRFQKANGGKPPGQNTMEAYDAVRLALDAIKRAGSTDPAKLRDAIAATTDLRMLTGTVRFNPDGSRQNPTFLLLRASAGEFALAP
jgi:branched-chain amino acid transport system substrate-binding protein